MNTKPYEKILYKDLSYQIQGAAIEVRKNFGSGLKESIYQNAFAEELKSRNLKFEKEKSIKIFSPKTGKLIGSYRHDFIVEEKILIELKAVDKIPKMFIDQIYSYLRNSAYELGYFINFASPKLYIKRVIFTNDRKSFLNKLSCLLAFLFVFFSVFAPAARAAEIYFSSQTQEVAVGQQFQVSVFLNTNGEEINAVEGKIMFPGELLNLQEIRDGNSIVNFWVEKPKIESSGRINFSGIIPGGYRGQRGLLLTLIFIAKKEGQGTIELRETKTLLNDGNGTEASLTISPYQFTISKAVSTPVASPTIDTEPPESFAPEIARDSAIADGKWFAVFATQDKKSGIDHYEIKETRYRNLGLFSKWISAESPYVLRDQELRSYVFVKAVDKAGNERIEIISPRNPLAWYESYKNWIIIILVFATLYAIKKLLWRKNTKQHEY